MKKTRSLLLLLLLFCSLCLCAQNKWNYSLGLGASLNTGNVNNCNINNDIAVSRNDSVLAFDFLYKLQYSSLINKDDVSQQWKENNFEVYGGIKMHLNQHDTFSPFWAFEALTNKYKGYNVKTNALAGVKYKIYEKPSVCEYSLSAAIVYDWTAFTDETQLPSRNLRVSFRPKFTHKLAENLTLQHRTYYQPSVLDFGDYIINSKTQLQTKLTKKFSLDVSFIYEYRSRIPSENYKKNDVQTMITIRYKV